MTVRAIQATAVEVNNAFFGGKHCILLCVGGSAYSGEAATVLITIDDARALCDEIAICADRADDFTRQGVNPGGST